MRLIASPRPNDMRPVTPTRSALRGLKAPV